MRILIIKFVGEHKPKEIIIGATVEESNGNGIMAFERPNLSPIAINFNNAEYWWFKEMEENKNECN